MHVQLVDPAAYTPPYDHALASALAKAGARVDLITTASPEWDAAIAGTLAQGALPYERHVDFYRHGSALPARWRTAARALEHPMGLRRLRARPADVTHLQWAPLQELDALALPRGRPVVITAHDVLPREARRFQRAAQRAIYARADLVIAHSGHGKQRLIDEAGVPERKIRVIAHGAFEHLTAVPRAPLPRELTTPLAPRGVPVGGGSGVAENPSGGAGSPALDAAKGLSGTPQGAGGGPAQLGRLTSTDVWTQPVRAPNRVPEIASALTAAPARTPVARRPVVLSFGLIRPYKGTDVLLRAWKQVKADAELWIVGKPRGVDLTELRALADDRVRFVPRFVSDGELAACFDAAQLAVLPYREIEQSGVLATALAFGTPVLASAVGAFPEAEALHAAATVPPADEAALAAAIDRLIGDPTERALLTVGARAIARGAWSWDAVAEQHLAAYAELVR